MTADAEHGLGCAEEHVLLNGFLELDTPGCLRAEFLEGEIVVSPLPVGAHAHVWSRIVRQVHLKSATDLDISARKGLELVGGRRCYAMARIPLYLLADRDAQTLTLFSEPDPGFEDYREDVRVTFGKSLNLPEPFAFSLETTDFT